jgi:hypothetical protein
MENQINLKKKNLFFIIIIIIAVSIVSIISFIAWEHFTGVSELEKNKLLELPIEKDQAEKTKSQSSTKIVLAKSLIKSDDIVLEKIDVIPKIPSYNLPLKTKDISNWQKFSEKISLNSEAQSLLEKNGFVVIPTPENIKENPDDFASFYSTLKWKDLPIFITTDSLLHYYHIFFDTTLMKLERDLFYEDIWEMSEEFLNDAIQEYKNADGDLKKSAKGNVAYFSVALKLLQPAKNQIISDKTLKEEYCFSGMSLETCKKMIDGVKNQYGDKASYKYFSEPESKKYDFEIPDFVKNEVEEEIELIEKHEGWKFSPIFIYKEDYSQYVPRGHYTKSEKLKNYFKTLMWYGRMTNLIKGSEDIPIGKSLRKIQEEGVIMSGENGLISAYDAKIQTLQANLIAKKFLESENIQEKWNRMYAITGFFVGFSDDLGPYEYSAVLKSLFKDEKEIKSQEIGKNYSEIKDTLSNLSYNPKIYSGLDAVQLVMPCPPLSDKDIQQLKIQAKTILENTKGFRLMGQRFTVDSYLFSEIVSPYSGEYNGPKLSLPTDKKPFTFFWDDEYSGYRENRPFSWTKTAVSYCPTSREVKGFPRGLDVMALFGSERAKEILENENDTKYSDYEKKFSELKSEIDSFSTDDWFKNIYWNWLYVLKSLFGEFSSGHQTFMQTDAWQDKELNTALASWSELRHDTILYVKQSYTMAEMGCGPEAPIVGYVEPTPEFYARLLTLTKMTNKGLKELVSQEELEELKIELALDRFSEILSRLLEISKKELENKVLTDQDYEFIENFGSTSEGLIKIISGGDVDPDIFKTVLVADVHTDGNTEKVLEEGVGYIKTLIAAYKLPQGHILIGVGPVFSYYEFKQPMKDRLTDEKWREMLNSQHPSEPKWTKSFSE